MPSPSSAVKPLPLHKPPSPVQEEVGLREVLALSQHQGVWSALATVLQAEHQHHLRAAAFCEDRDERNQHIGLVRWLDEVLSGSMMARYTFQAKERLGISGAPEEPSDGSPYMQSDLLED